MAMDSIAKINPPGQMGRRAIGVVVEACQEATDPADGDRDGQRQNKDCPGRTANAEGCLVYFRHHDAAEDGTQDAASTALRTGEPQIDVAETIGAGNRTQPEDQQIDRVAPPRHGKRSGEIAPP